MSRRRKALLFALCAILLLSAIYLAYELAAGVNSFFEGVMGEEMQAKVEAPIVEELLKPLGLVVLVAVFLSIERVRPVRIGYLRSARVCYAVGFASGVAFGALENWLSYASFSGFRSATPFLHAVGTGLVGVGIYYVLVEGKSGLAKLISLYFAAVSLHAVCNNIGSPVVLAVLGVSATVMGIAALLLSLLFELWGKRL